MILVAGGLFLIVGLISGLLLALAPLGVTPYQPGWVTWFLFPGLTVLGYTFVLLASRSSVVPIITRATGGALLLLAVVATVSIFLLAKIHSHYIKSFGQLSKLIACIKFKPGIIIFFTNLMKPLA